MLSHDWRSDWRSLKSYSNPKPSSVNPSTRIFPKNLQSSFSADKPSGPQYHHSRRKLCVVDDKDITCWPTTKESIKTLRSSSQEQRLAYNVARRHVQIYAKSPVFHSSFNSVSINSFYTPSKTWILCDARAATRRPLPSFFIFLPSMF
jgi:hypothetical protein